MAAPTIEPGEPLKCDRYYTDRHTNISHFIYGGYEGIPENLLINLIVWIVLLSLFTLLRKIAWDYGRLALISRSEARWTAIFYANRSNFGEVRTSQESLDTSVQSRDTGFCSWICAFFAIKDKNILEKCGADAVQYLSFQRYLLVYMAIITVLCIGVILPLNFQGTLEGTTQTFGHTTISNIDSKSPILWVHATFAVLFLLILVGLMQHFLAHLLHDDDAEQATRTLMISNIPRHACNKRLIELHFREAYPEANLVDIQFAYNISKLIKIDKLRQDALEGQINSEAILRRSGERPTMIPYPCGRWCRCCGCKEVDAIDYYAAREKHYRDCCVDEKQSVVQSCLGIMFVSFENSLMASRVATDFKVSCKGAHNPVNSSFSQNLRVYNWEVQYAPTPANINWGNLSVSPAIWWMKAFGINTVIFVFFFFLTTPSLILNLLNQQHFITADTRKHSKILVKFVPTLILWIVAALMPNIVYWSDQILGHWTRTAEHLAVMRKSFIFLLLMIIILPSLGLTSAKALFEWFVAKNSDQFKFRWQCVFIPDNGAFFVNYVITAALIGTAVELIRVPELLLYVCKLALSKSDAERTSIRKSVLWGFQFGAQYAWMLCVFAVVITYSIPCPLITPFGLLYLLNKHLVDRYNIYFAYSPSSIDHHIHTTAINFVIIAVIILQCCIVFFTLLRMDHIQGVCIFSVVCLFISLVIFFGRMCFGWFKGFSHASPYKHIIADDESSRMEDSEASPPLEYQPFIASVLLEGNGHEGMSQKADYGATRGLQDLSSPSADAAHGNEQHLHSEQVEGTAINP